MQKISYICIERKTRGNHARHINTGRDSDNKTLPAMKRSTLQKICVGLTSVALLLFLACPVYHNSLEAITGWEFIKASSIFKYTFMVNTEGHAEYFLCCLPRPILFLLWCLGNISLMFSRRYKIILLGISLSIPMYIYMLASSAANYTTEYVLWGTYVSMVLTATALGMALKSRKESKKQTACGKTAELDNEDDDQEE